MSKFAFSKELEADLASNGKAWDALLFKACLEAKEADVKASLFAEALRKSGFKCGTGPARAAYKAVRNGKTQKAMIAAVSAVKAKRKAGKTDAGKTDAGKTDAGKTDADTLVGALTNAAHAAKNGNLAVVETWLVKAQALLATAKLATNQAVEKMGGVSEKTA